MSVIHFQMVQGEKIICVEREKAQWQNVNAIKSRQRIEVLTLFFQLFSTF